MRHRVATASFSACRGGGRPDSHHFPCIAVVADWEREHARSPAIGDLPALQLQAASTASREGVAPGVFAADMLEQWLDGEAGELAPVNAVRPAAKHNDGIK